MDEKKRLELLGLLESDARQTIPQLAVALGETEEAVAREVAALEEQRVIVRYHTLVDWDRAGTDYVTAWIDVKITPQRDFGFDRLAERIARFPEVNSCYLMSGAYDLAVEIQAPTLRAVSRFVSERLSTLDGVHSTATHFVLKRYKHDGILFGGEEEDQERLAVTP